jgi:hypothetical protein
MIILINLIPTIKEVTETQTQRKKFPIKEIKNSNESTIEISIRNYAQTMSRNIVNFAMEGMLRYKESSISIVSFLLHI